MNFTIAKHIRWFATGLAVVFVFAGSAGHVLGAVVTLTPIKDNTIYQGVDPGSLENYEDHSCGAGTSLFAGVTNDNLLRRALLEFDIAAAIPAGSVINSVTLTLVINRSGDNQPAAMTLHALAKEWGEGNANCDSIRGGGQGIDAGFGEATWLSAQHQLLSWTNAGGDYDVASAAAMVPTSGDAIWDSGENPVMVADVQAWLDDPATNVGWVVIGDEARASTARRFFSREGRTPPTLTIDFTPVGDVSACCFDDGGCSVLDSGACLAQGGIADPNFDTCLPNPCPQPTGACCNLDESCTDDVERATCEADGGSFQGSGAACSDNAVDCGLEPFVDPLPLPGVLQPVGTRADGVLQYEIIMTEEAQQLHRDLPPTDVWTYNGTYPGPTFEATVGQPIEVRYVNDLPSGQRRRGGHMFEIDECAHGPSYWQDTARTVVHLHGGHVPARFDGQPEYDFMPGAFDVYEYPNNQLPATLWYHDHALGITRLNVYAGLAGFYLLRDAFEDSLGLPAGSYEIPIVIQDREFNPDGSLFYNPTLQDAFKGNKILVNGKVWPFLEVQQGKYRFRLLNGSQSREYSLRLQNRANTAQVIPFTLIGTDGGLIDAPLSVETLNISPGERMDLVIDFGGFDAGTEIILRNGDPTEPLLPNVMKFNVLAGVGFTGSLPATLRPVLAIDPRDAVVDRYFRLVKVTAPCPNDPDRSIGEWLIQSLDGPDGAVIGEHWDDISEFPILGDTEIWEFENPSNVMHPMHVHLVMFQVVDKVNMDNGQSIPLTAWENKTWKDTVRVPPRSRVRVIMTFENYLGVFPYHCHILDHEDHEMMRQFQAINDPANCNNNGICEAGEDCISCADCDQVSSAFCGNGLCEIGDGEDCQNCPEDCAGKAKGKNPYCCGQDVNCDDARCTDGYFCRQEPRVMACCGDTLCEGQENETSCAVDCADETGSIDCTHILDRDVCNAEPGCAWQGSRRSGNCALVSGGDCTPSEVPETSCGDGLDNDCDTAIDCDDADCSGDPLCQAVDCSTFTDKVSCQAQATCQWNNRSKSCVPN